MKSNTTQQRFLMFSLLSVFVAALLQGCLSLGTFSSTRMVGDIEVPPVYNADFKLVETGKSTGTDLRAGSSHRLEFWIGAPDASSVIGPVPPNLEILRSTAPLRLRVVFGCAFCTSYGVSQQAMVYVPSAQQSNPVAFEFVPGVVDPDSRATTVQIAIYDDGTGRLYDEISIPVSLAGPVASQMPKPVVLRMSPRRDRGLFQPDATLHITEWDRTRLTITLVPVSQRAKEAVGDLVLDENNKVRSFQTAPHAMSALKGLGMAENARMSAMSLQGSLAQALRRTGAVPLISESSRERSTLTEQESKEVTQLIGNYGRTLHKLLFCPTSTDSLCKAISALEALAASNPDQPLSLSISSGELSLPWQYLHPAGAVVEAPKFWGIAFSLAVQRSRPAGTEFPSALPPRPPARKVIFAQYAVESNAAYGRSEVQIAKLQGLPITPENLRVVRSRNQLMTQISGQDRDDVAAIFTFLHARSGVSPETTAGNIVTSSEGPILEFADKDAISSSQLAKLYGTTTDERYFGAGPLVILNACETGPSGMAMPHVQMQDALFLLGVRGIVVTEVPVWIPLGHEIGMLLIDELGRGASAPDALTTVRRKILSQNRNPLGLLYAYYGEPGVFFNR